MPLVNQLTGKEPRAQPDMDDPAPISLTNDSFLGRPSPTFRSIKWDKDTLPERKSSGSSSRPIVILIGPTNVGKGTLANWLFNFGVTQNFLPDGKPYPDGWKLPFEQRQFDSSQKPHTLDPYLVEMPDHGIDLLDITGINDERDLRNCAVLFSFLSVLPISGAIFCQKWDQADDKVYALNMEFYCTLLKPLFDAKKVVLALTNVSESDYEQARQWNKWYDVVKLRLDAFNKFIPDSEASNRLDMALPFACVFLHKVHLKYWKKPQLFGRDGGLFQCSTESRAQLFSIFRRTSLPVNLGPHFPLPPFAELKRQEKKNALKAERERILKTLAQAGSQQKEAFKEMQLTDFSLQNIEMHIKSSVSELAKTSKIQTTKAECISGNSWINFLGRGTELKITVPGNPSKKDEYSWTPVQDPHNCSWNLKETSEDGLTKTFTVVPHAFHFSGKSIDVDGTTVSKTWYFRLWATYDGRSGNYKLIADLIETLHTLWEEYRSIISDSLKAKELHTNATSELKELKASDDILSHQYRFLSSAPFHIKDFASVTSLIDPSCPLFEEITTGLIPEWICRKIGSTGPVQSACHNHERVRQTAIRAFDLAPLVDVLLFLDYDSTKIGTEFPGLLESLLCVSIEKASLSPFLNLFDQRKWMVDPSEKPYFKVCFDVLFNEGDLSALKPDSRLIDRLEKLLATEPFKTLRSRKNAAEQKPLDF